MFEHLQSARGTEVAESCRMTSLHDSKVHEQRYLNANRLIAEQTSRASHRVLRVGRGLRSRLTDQQDDAVVGGV